MGLHRLIEVIEGRVLERHHLNDAGVVDQQVDPASHPGDLVDDIVHRGFVTNVALEDGDTATQRLQANPGAIQIGARARQKRHVRAFKHQPSGEREPESARAAGDDHRPIAEGKSRPAHERPGRQGGADERPRRDRHPGVREAGRTTVWIHSSLHTALNGRVRVP